MVHIDNQGLSLHIASMDLSMVAENIELANTLVACSYIDSPSKELASRKEAIYKLEDCLLYITIVVHIAYEDTSNNLVFEDNLIQTMIASNPKAKYLDRYKMVEYFEVDLKAAYSS